MSAVIFNVQKWFMRYPEFAAIPPARAQLYFDEAGLYLKNELGIVKTVDQLEKYLFMVTAHIAKLNAPADEGGRGADAPAGRLSSVTQGSVTAQFEIDLKQGAEQWWGQTTYGLAFWRATRRFRLALYLPGLPGPASLSQLPWFGIRSFGGE